ncbi:MAG: hypothetical protein GY870_21555, partial [archaeon]|nr:hypothetical protein [archaeon]
MVKKNTKKKEEWDGPDRKQMIEVAKIMNLVLEPGIKVVACKTKDLWKDIQDNAEDIYLSDDDEDGTLTEFYKENNLEFGIEGGDDDTDEKPVEEVAEEKTEELEEEVLPEPEKEVEKPAA